MVNDERHPSPIRAPEHVLALLERLHKLSLDQEAAVDYAEIKAQGFDSYMRDKFIALEQDKCQFLYQLSRAINAKNIVEAGTSFGVSTIYLSLAVGDNIAASGGTGVVIGTEQEDAKATQAKAYWAEAGEQVNKYIDLRQGDLRETLKDDIPAVDLLLLDIWTPMALPALKLIEPHFRPGAVVVADNTIGASSGYKDLLEYLRAEDSPFTNLCLPYSKGLEMSVYSPRV